MNTTSNPIFLGGLFKSGTSLLRAMVGQHSNIASGLETTWFDVDWEGRTGPGGKPIEAYFQQQANWFDFSEDKVNSMAAESANIHEFISRLLDAYAESQGKPRWAEKTPGNVRHIDRIMSGWPGARFVHIIRNPLDVLASLRESNKWDDAETFSTLWCSFFGAVEDFRQQGVITAENYLEIRYEGLITDAEGTMRGVMDFVGEPWEEAVAHFEGKSDDYQKVLDQTGIASSTLERLAKPITNERIAIWRRVLSESDIEAVRERMDQQGRLELFDRIVDEANRFSADLVA
ncbi:MAG: sulfotransferase family protein [Gammaproteobacteria bacterium]